MRAYTDGSNIRDEAYSFACVIVDEETDTVIHTMSVKYEDEHKALRNVAGEVKGAIYALSYALSNNYPAIEIRHDYTGVYHWAVKEWRAKQPLPIMYQQIYAGVSDKLEVTFTKVKAHAGDKYNEMADQLAKEALGLKK